MSTHEVLGPSEKPRLSRWIPLSFQHVFAMFGATVLVPLLTGLSPSTALFTAGTGTLLYILITGAKVPAFLGSSFAFIRRWNLGRLRSRITYTLPRLRRFRLV